ALGVYTLGTVVVVVISAASWAIDPGGRRAALVLGAALVGFAVVAAVLLPGQLGGDPTVSPLARCVQMVRVASATSLPLLYALALGGVTAGSGFLPAYLGAGVGLPWGRAAGGARVGGPGRAGGR